MSIGTEMAFRRSARGKDATGSLVFDAERNRAKTEKAPDAPTTAHRPAKARVRPN